MNDLGQISVKSNIKMKQISVITNENSVQNLELQHKGKMIYSKETLFRCYSHLLEKGGFLKDKKLEHTSKCHHINYKQRRMSELTSNGGSKNEDAFTCTN